MLMAAAVIGVIFDDLYLFQYVIRYLTIAIYLKCMINIPYHQKVQLLFHLLLYTAFRGAKLAIVGRLCG